MTTVALVWGPLDIEYWDLTDADAGPIHVLLTCIFLLFVLLQAAVFAAPSLTAEKEVSSWPVLLSTTLHESTIIWSKAVGVVRRILPAIALLLGYVLLFSLFQFVHPLLILHTVLIVVAFVPFVIATALWFSLRLQRTTTAVVSSFVPITLLCILPFCLLLIDETTDSSWSAPPPMWNETPEPRLFETLGLRALVLNPFVWMGMASYGGAAAMRLRTPYDSFWTGYAQTGGNEFTLALLITCTIMLLVSFLIFRTTVNRFNRLAGRAS